MTKQDFELIARLLREHRTTPGRVTMTIELSHRFAHELAVTNPRFDRAVFLAACGVESTR